MRSARQALGLSLEEIENVTRIRRSFLVALEQETFDVLPGPAYVRGFLRTYATYLGIPQAELLELYPGPSVGTKAGTILHRESPVEVRITPAIRLSPTRRVLVGVALLGGLGVVALGVVLYGQIRQFAETPASSQGPSKPSTPLTSSAPSAPKSTLPAPRASPVAPRVAPPKPPAAAPPVPTPSGAPVIPVKPPAAPSPAAVPGAAPIPPKPGTPPGPGPTGGTTPPTPGKVPGSPPAPPSSPTAGPLHVAVAASGHSWVRTVADGTTVFEGFVNAGDKQVWEAKRSLTVKVGNAGAVDLSLNGKSLGRLGASGQVYEHTFSAGPPPP
ncbi:MAG TPA: RodZ domain-containing protein [bacterium]|nr:RodZ domain-containing protein [bacterium]